MEALKRTIRHSWGLRGGFGGKGIQLESSQISGGQTGTCRGRREWAGEDSWQRKQKEKSLKREIRSLRVRKGTQKGCVAGFVRWVGGWDVGGPKCQGAKGAELSIWKKENRKHFQDARGAGMGWF